METTPSRLDPRRTRPQHGLHIHVYANEEPLVIDWDCCRARIIVDGIGRDGGSPSNVVEPRMPFAPFAFGLFRNVCDRTHGTTQWMI